MHFGITPVFCDANENGTISASAIAKAITDKTKAVIVTHVGYSMRHGSNLLGTQAKA